MSNHRLLNLPLIALVVVLLAGIFLRLPPSLFFPSGSLYALASFHPQPMNTDLGFDEGLYRDYANKLSRFGLSSYPEIVQRYREEQETLTGSILPPVRFLFVFAAASWHLLFGTEMLAALRNVSALFSILTLLLATLFAKRLARPGYSLGIAALMAFAPTQLHMSQHGLADGFFTFWVTLILWSLWENFRSPGDWRWLSLLIGALAAIVLTKENAFFVWLGMIAILIANRWLRWGRITRELILAVFLGPTLGVVMLIFLAGGIPELLATYHLSVTKNYALEYAVLTGDGPWYRYLVDLLLVSPVVLLLAICSVFRLTRDSKVEWFFFIFIAATYAIMCNIKYGMNLRYANMWDLPLRVLAVGQLATFAGLANRRSNIVMAVSVITVCAIEFQQYIILAVNFPLYELITPHLLRAFGILKDNLGP